MKWIRNNAPFVMLWYCLVFALVQWMLNPEDYYFLYGYLSQGLGFSFFTNLVFISFYFNKYYCDTTKLAVLGLTSMNLISLVYVYLELNSNYYYDFFISLICLVVYVSKKRNRN